MKISYRIVYEIHLLKFWGNPYLKEGYKTMKSLLSILCFAFFLPWLKSQPDFEKLRDLMVRRQLQSRDIDNKEVLRAMRKVPRHLFVPENQQPYAYEDTPLPIGEGQTISQPYMVAYMTQALRLKPEDHVLEIGTGSGYQAAVLSEIVDSVSTIEIVESLGLKAEITLKEMGYDNVRVIVGDGYHGLPESAPFEAIMVTAGAEEIPQPLIDQLAVGGRMIIPVGPHRGVRNLVRLTKRKNGELKRENLMAVRFVPFTRNKYK